METSDEFPTYDVLQVAEKARGDIESLYVALLLSPMLLALVPPVPLRWRGILWRTFFVTLVVWYAMDAYRLMYEVPWIRLVLDIKRENPMYDGVGGNTAILLLGWLLPFCQCLGVLLVIKFFAWLFQKNPKTVESPPAVP